MIIQDKLAGYAFPLIKVSYTGPTDAHGARWSASVAGMRLRASYNVQDPSGTQNALPVAQRLWDRAVKRYGLAGETASDFIFIPVDVGRDVYGFVPINKRILNTIDVPMAAGRYVGTLVNVREDTRT